MNRTPATKRIFAASSRRVRNSGIHCRLERVHRAADPQPGRINGLAQTLIKMVAPGLPDFYQGTELWDLSLVDPDNRRPVDFDQRARSCCSAARACGAEVMQRLGFGTAEAVDDLASLGCAGRGAASCLPASRYQPLVAQGSHLGKLLAFRRGENLIAVVPRFTMT
jgi:(1->4)-alpha-D-glucan 1-alpha-D-glucosylmutase